MCCHLCKSCIPILLASHTLDISGGKSQLLVSSSCCLSYLLLFWAWCVKVETCGFYLPFWQGYCPSLDKPHPFVFKIVLASKLLRLSVRQNSLSSTEWKLWVNFMSVPSVIYIPAMVWFPDACDKPAAMWPCLTLKRICLKCAGLLLIGRPTL